MQQQFSDFGYFQGMIHSSANKCHFHLEGSQASLTSQSKIRLLQYWIPLPLTVSRIPLVPLLRSLRLSGFNSAVWACTCKPSQGPPHFPACRAPKLMKLGSRMCIPSRPPSGAEGHSMMRLDNLGPTKGTAGRVPTECPVPNPRSSTAGGAGEE